MHKREIVRCRHLAQAAVSHLPAVAASTTLQLSDRTSVTDQFSLVDAAFPGYNMTDGSGFENSPIQPAAVIITTFWLFRC